MIPCPVDVPDRIAADWTRLTDSERSHESCRANLRAGRGNRALDREGPDDPRPEWAQRYYPANPHLPPITERTAS